MIWRTLRGLFICACIFLFPLIVSMLFQEIFQVQNRTFEIVLLLAVFPTPFIMLCYGYKVHKKSLRSRVLQKTPEHLRDRFLRLEEIAPDEAWQILDRYGPDLERGKNVDESCKLIDEILDFQNTASDADL